MQPIATSVVLTSGNICKHKFMLKLMAAAAKAVSKTPSGVKTGATALKSVDYEVSGKVQGVFFRKHTQKTALKYGLVGYVQNTPRGTVVGQVQGPEDKILIMKNWLKKTGSPKSRIDHCVFKDEKVIEKYDHSAFVVVK